MAEFKCGLTLHDLKQLFHLKVLNNVFLENVPQLFFLWLFTTNVGRLSDSAWFSLIGSVLSVLATTLTYLIDREQSDNVLPLNYYLELQCERVQPLTPMAAGNIMTTTKGQDVNPGNDLSKKEEALFAKHGGRTLAFTYCVLSIYSIYCAVP